MSYDFVVDAQVRACVLSPESDSAFKSPERGSTFLRKYVEYGMERTDAPAIFHLATGLALLSAATAPGFALGNVFGAETYPNLYVMLLGPSASRKTFAGALGFRRIFRPCFHERASALPGSYEGLIDSLNEQRLQLVFDGEMSRFFNQARGDGHLGALKKGLMEIYDGEPLSRRTVRRKIDPFSDYRFSFIGAIALDEFEAHVEATDITGGLLSRFLLAVSNRDHLGLQSDQPNYVHQDPDLQQQLRWIGGSCPKNFAVMSAEAVAYVNELTKSWDTVERGVALERWASIWERAAAHVRKIALLLALDQYSLTVNLPAVKTHDGAFWDVDPNVDRVNLPPVSIGIEHVRKAGEIVKLFVTTAVQMVDRLPTTKQAKEIQLTLKAVEARALVAQSKAVPGATFGSVSRAAGLNYRTTQHMLQTLVQQGVVIEIPTTRGQTLYAPRQLREGVDPSWEMFSGGYDPDNPPTPLATPMTLPHNVVAFPTPAASPKTPEPALSVSDARALGLID